MNKQRELHLEIAGYYESSDPEAFNISLSKKRAEGIKNYLVKNGINPDRIKTIGMGSKNPEPGRRIEGRWFIRSSDGNNLKENSNQNEQFLQ